MKLKDWIGDKELSDKEWEKLSKHMDTEVEVEFMMHKEDSFIPWSTFGHHKNVYSWVLLKNGLAVGWNESPSRGWSFPSKKITSNVKQLINKN